MPFCKVDGHQIHYKLLDREGFEKGRPILVFLHEGLGSIAQWKDYPEEISTAAHLPALVYDRYGYGFSDALQEKRTSDYLWEEARSGLPGLLEHLHIYNPLILIGHSDGATIALMFASLFPDRCRCVISEAAHVLLEDISRSGIKQAIRSFEEERLREFLQRYHGDRTDTMFYGWAHTWTSEDMDSWDMKDALHKITSPVLAIQGIADEYGSPEQLRWIETYCGGKVETWLVPDCAHIPHFQQREAVGQRMLSFISEHKEPSI